MDSCSFWISLFFITTLFFIILTDDYRTFTFDWSDTKKHSSFRTIMKCLENMFGGLISQPNSLTIESSSINSRFMIRRTESELPLVCRSQSMIRDTRWSIGERSLRMTLGGSWRSIRKKFQSNLRFITTNSMNSLIVFQQ